MVLLTTAVSILPLAACTNDEANDASPKPATATAKVTRGDLVTTETISGNLGFAGSFPITNRLSGTITALSAEGRTIRRGQMLYAVDGRRVVLMYGRTPAYRPLSVGVEGPDVRQLEKNLVALGYGGSFDVDNEFTYATARAVRQWQDDLGLPRTGRVELGRVVFADGSLRVSEVKVNVGSAAGPGGEVYTATTTRRVVTVDVPVADQALVRRGATVVVELPGGRTTKGKVSRVGAVARDKSDDAQDGNDEGSTGTATIEVEVTLNDPRAPGRLDQAPVDVRFESERRKRVLSVPVNALLALREGGYGVEVMDAGASRIVPVQTGLFANGRVEVSGAGLRQGMTVKVPAS
jgi:peptidoglycan hydrolase-like protein with peptidoglycan-binding domain